ncbi:MAG: response regulator transcription factor [Candidatus Sumerlaeia bacterium]|nr:response regulator transcription factor [Candidatus Sumerlaeia bacterium]
MSAATLRVLIVDDEPLARERLRMLLARVGGNDVAGEAADGHQALRAIDELQPDVVFLDIRMPGLDGLRVIEALDDPPPVVLSTAHEEHAVRAFDLDVADYLLKPYSAERVARALDRARRLASPAPPTRAATRVAAQDGASTVLVPVDAIVAIRLEEGVVFIHREDGERLIADDPLQRLEEILAGGDLLRVSRQALVNLRRVESFEPTDEGGLRLRLSDGSTETASRRRARAVRARLG